jgi:CheY-like chemotaxis protein
MHGGTIDATSAGTGKGATFTARIPAAEPPGDAPAAAPAAKRSGPRKVQIVEDNLDARETLRAALELDGCEVRAAADGPAGLAALKEWDPDAVIVDIGLPGMDGHAVARAIRAHAGEDIQLIALTGYGLAEDEQAAQAAGFDAHLVKPADMTRLRALLREGAEGRP